MSRRESRVSINIRQNDALLEFENFKKRFLLANKHITKLNSTLSLKIEELNAQISALNVENLRLRSTEIALCAQLRREKDKSRSIMADAEAAVMALMNQFGSLRESHKVPAGKRAPKPSPVPTIRSRPQANNTSPPLPRVARPPNFPEIVEEDEVEGDTPTLSARRKSLSRLPIPSKLTAPAAPIEVEEPQPKQKKKSGSRRQSGLIASGKPIEALLSPPPEPAVVPDPLPLVEDDAIFPVLNEQEEELEAELEVPKKRKRSKRREKEEDSVLLVLEGTTSRLRDVTNSPQKPNFLPPLDTTDVHRLDYLDSASEIPTSATSVRTNSTRAFLSTAATTPCPSTPATGYLPSPRVSSSPPPEVDPIIKEPDPPNNAGGRTGRVRKSVNYAEPKLNTKMRKPDPPGSSTLKRASGSIREREDSPPESRPPSSSSSNSSEPPATTRKVKRKVVPPDDPETIDVASDDDDGMQADAEFGGGTPWTSTTEKRRRSAMVAKSRSSIEEARRHSMTS
ncbi:hypothetical protein BJ322DRAFT_1030505 [Thelephora terrestris]|uniref:Shugoshin C-terminal domain-containing protein n=1 Tax=Thelephora terrestris TaxID=56493 RepID=A0A9P6HRN5_9AGAM|nr:hypothetical protein BJ322DRAFT_1030505 [Thelephora terrestris]